MNHADNEWGKPAVQGGAEGVLRPGTVHWLQLLSCYAKKKKNQIGRHDSGANIYLKVHNAIKGSFQQWFSPPVAESPKCKLTVSGILAFVSQSAAESKAPPRMEQPIARLVFIGENRLTFVKHVAL